MGTAAETLERAKRIADRLETGTLPWTASKKLWAGFGNGRRSCDGFGDPIPVNEVEHEHDLVDGGSVRFHAACSVLWQRMTEKKA
jgi:hypothetical protein